MKITNVERLTQERWVNLFAATFEHNGHSGRWVFASRREKPHGGLTCDAVVIIPILRNPGEPPRLVLIREFRVPAGGYVLGLPAGLVEPGEDIEEAIRREMREETGFEVTAIRRITQPLYSTSGLSDETSALAFIDVQGNASSVQALEASEDIEVILADHERICQLCDDRSVMTDAKVWEILFLYQQLGRLD